MINLNKFLTIVLALTIVGLQPIQAKVSYQKHVMPAMAIVLGALRINNSKVKNPLEKLPSVVINLGLMGISVYAYTSEPKIVSNNILFSLQKYLVPSLLTGYAWIALLAHTIPDHFKKINSFGELVDAINCTIDRALIILAAYYLHKNTLAFK